MISSFGYFVRSSDKKRIQRFRCRPCGKSFSQASTQACYYQKKRRLNPRIRELLCSGVSQRRMAKLLKISRTTVVRKFLFLSSQAQDKNHKHLHLRPLVREMQFDDLETVEHTKCKPLSVTMALEKHTREILGFRVSRMPAKGPLAHLARKKYGPRVDERGKNREDLFKALAPRLEPEALIESDENPHYPLTVKRWCPRAVHKTCRGQRGCVAGQGELKKVGYDPLFSLNHTYAMLRANINRLFRKTWCTTKRPDRLAAHLHIYVHYHNTELLKKPLA